MSARHLIKYAGAHFDPGHVVAITHARYADDFKLLLSTGDTLTLQRPKDGPYDRLSLDDIAEQLRALQDGAQR